MIDTTTIAWMSLPFFLGFFIFLISRLDRVLAMSGAIPSAAFAFLIFSSAAPVSLKVLDNFGVTLLVDSSAATLF